MINLRPAHLPDDAVHIARLNNFVLPDRTSPERVVEQVAATPQQAACWPKMLPGRSSDT